MNVRALPKEAPEAFARKAVRAVEVSISDDFSPEKIMASGQCFRVRRFPGENYRFVTGGHALYLHPLGEGRFEVSCTPEEWSGLWAPYFDLERDYRALRRRAGGKHPFVDAAMAEGTGLRILRQDPWEMLITFLISQRKSIPAIASAVETLAERWGSPVETAREDLYAFPSPEAMAGVTEEELRACALGYRAPYVLDAVRRVSGGELDLAALGRLEDEELFRSLQEVRGVGKKVSECVCLFGYGRLRRVPVDVWIDRAIREECSGCEPFSLYGEDAGVIQQYVFYAMRRKKKVGNRKYGGTENG